MRIERHIRLNSLDRYVLLMISAFPPCSNSNSAAGQGICEFHSRPPTQHRKTRCKFAGGPVPPAELLPRRGESSASVDTRSSESRSMPWPADFEVTAALLLLGLPRSAQDITQLSLQSAALPSLLALLFSKLLRSSGLNGYHEEHNTAKLFCFRALLSLNPCIEQDETALIPLLP